jgi:hypothetical protein
VTAQHNFRKLFWRFATGKKTATLLPTWGKITFINLTLKKQTFPKNFPTFPNTSEVTTNLFFRSLTLPDARSACTLSPNNCGELHPK